MSLVTTTVLQLIKPVAGTSEPASIFASYNESMDALEEIFTAVLAPGGNMAIDFNSASTRTFTIINSGAGVSQLLLDLGAVGTPSHSFTGDANTGMYSPGADQVGIAVGGVAAELFSATGAITRPLQPAFLAYNAATVTNQTGNGAVATAPFGTEVFDQTNNFASNTFTAPVTGRYRFSVQVTPNNLSVAMTLYTLSLVTSNRTYTYSISGVPDVSTARSLKIDVLADMDAADTASVTVAVSNGAGDTAGILGAATLHTFFSGELVA